jgi:uncharacterized protein (DUF488 family)
MVAGAKEVAEAQVVQALETAHAAIKQIDVIDDLAKDAGKKKLQVRREIGKEFYRGRKVLVPLTDAM